MHILERHLGSKIGTVSSNLNKDCEKGKFEDDCKISGLCNYGFTEVEIIFSEIGNVTDD